ncbi:hypothetical protein BACCELL_03629 [Bacteroides cellulosilyticus DSM 14838]|uniref:Uncharacterized protein n=1 Tax=Bacteroides cellulosilyticus DSM 14838 TaxID=537012 RepID=E2NH53_9BACE|nr:hypothetical protein BACCELL_03629 [Bacteroides cellulosilyticus DSM 14838]
MVSVIDENIEYTPKRVSLEKRWHPLLFFKQLNNRKIWKNLN